MCTKIDVQQLLPCLVTH